MKPYADLGHAWKALKPLQLRRYEAGNLPDPAQCVDCLIIVNDRHDGIPRARLAISNGASWDYVAFVVDAAPVEVPAASPPPFRQIDAKAVDLTPIISEVVSKVTRQLPAPPSPPFDLEALQKADRDTAKAYLGLADCVTTLQSELADLMARVEFLEHHAIAKVSAG